MCTAFYVRQNGHFFGRNLDLDRSLGEMVAVTPRNAPIQFRREKVMDNHYAFLGMAVKSPEQPLYYDGVNEKGLCMAGLNFPQNAVYHPTAEGKTNVAPFELIPWVLGQCESVRQAKELMERTNVLDLTFHPAIGHSPLHWIISGTDGSLTVESQADGLHIYENPVEVLTNNPPFPYHIMNLNNYRHLDPKTPENTFLPGLDLNVYCQGLGAVGLPGDVSSMSRFVRAAFYCRNSQWEDPVSQVFHILDAVKMVKGGCGTGEGTWDETVYSACMDADKGRYYYFTYGNRRVTCVDLYKENLESSEAVYFPLVKGQDILMQN